MKALAVEAMLLDSLEDSFYNEFWSLNYCETELRVLEGMMGNNTKDADGTNSFAFKQK